MCTFSSRFSKNLSESSTTTLVGVYDTQSQNEKVAAIESEGVSMFWNTWIKHITFLFLWNLHLIINNLDLMEGHLSSHKQYNSNIIKFKIFGAPIT